MNNNSNNKKKITNSRKDICDTSPALHLQSIYMYQQVCKTIKNWYTKFVSYSVKFCFYHTLRHNGRSTFPVKATEPGLFFWHLQIIPPTYFLSCSVLHLPQAQTLIYQTPILCATSTVTDLPTPIMCATSTVINLPNTDSLW